MTILSVIALGGALLIALAIFVLSLVGDGEVQRSSTKADVGDTGFSA